MKLLSAATRASKSVGRLPSASVMVALPDQMSDTSDRVPHIFLPYSFHPPPGWGTALVSARPPKPRSSLKVPQRMSPSAMRGSHSFLWSSVKEPFRMPTMM